MNYFAGAFYDAVWLYGLGLVEAAQKNMDARNGYQFTRKVLWDRTFEGELLLNILVKIYKSDLFLDILLLMIRSY